MNAIFHTTETGYRHLNGKPATLLSVITEPDDTHDPECLPMIVIAIDGIQLEVWPDEITGEPV
jgi:hypothetical protein